MTFSDSLYRLLRPALFQLEAERAHRLAVRLLAAMPPARGATAQHSLQQTLWSRDFPNPIGLAAGFDKNAEAWRGALGLGFGCVEIGSVTPRPQAGNPRPRLFRLVEDRAVINRMGFNNDGMEAVAQRLAARDPKAGIARADIARAGIARAGIVGVNLGKNKETVDAAADYELGVTKLGPLADYLVINVSSPNTPGLRALQGKEPLAELITRTRAARDRLQARPPLLLKIAPDLTEDDQRDIADVALELGLDGLIISNTTIARPPLRATRHAGEAGGLSGAPLFAPSTALLARMYRLTGGKMPLIGVGGIATARDVYAKIRAGASLVQIYSAMVYEGPGLAARLVRDLPALLAADGFATISAAIGADHR